MKRLSDRTHSFPTEIEHGWPRLSQPKGNPCSCKSARWFWQPQLLFTKSQWRAHQIPCCEGERSPADLAGNGSARVDCGKAVLS